MNVFSDVSALLFGEDVYRGGDRYGPITQSHLEFVLVQNGATEVETDGRRFRLGAGFAALILSRDYLCFDYHDGTETRVLWCEATVLPPWGAPDRLIPAQPAPIPVSRRMLELQRMGMDLGLESTDEVEMLRASLGRALFQEYLYQAHRSTRERPFHRSVLRAKDFIEQNISKPCTLGDIAQYSNVTPQHLTRIFKRDIAQTPIRYLWSLRAKKGAQMLRRSGLPVSEIAYRCGYENANHFSRHIKERFGAPPTELRRRRWHQ